MKGGCVNIDCTGLDLRTASAQTISGLYRRMQDAMKQNKPAFAYNLGWGSGKTMTPVQVFMQQEDSTTIVATASTLQIWVTSSDAATVVNMIQD